MIHYWNRNVKMHKKTINPLEASNIPWPSNFDRKIVRNFDLNDVWKFISPSLLYSKLLGLNENFKIAIKKGNEKAMMLQSDVEKIREQILSSQILKPKAIFQFLKCRSENDDIVLNVSSHDDIRFSFPRQQQSPYLCLSDYISSESDNLALFVVTSGHEVFQHSDTWNEEGRLKDSFILQSLAIATAESLAEYIHYKIRGLWGVQDQSILPQTSKYQGKRYSFGYSSCPNLDDQQIIWKLLKPEEIDVHLTESNMMDPEASVSAIVFHHPDAKYFNVTSL